MIIVILVLKGKHEMIIFPLEMHRRLGMHLLMSYWVMTNTYQSNHDFHISQITFKEKNHVSLICGK